MWFTTNYFSYLIPKKETSHLPLTNDIPLKIFYIKK